MMGSVFASTLNLGRTPSDDHVEYSRVIPGPPTPAGKDSIRTRRHGSAAHPHSRGCRTLVRQIELLMELSRTHFSDDSIQRKFSARERNNRSC